MSRDERTQPPGGAEAGSRAARSPASRRPGGAIPTQRRTLLSVAGAVVILVAAVVVWMQTRGDGPASDAGVAAAVSRAEVAESRAAEAEEAAAADRAAAAALRTDAQATTAVVEKLQADLEATQQAHRDAISAAGRDADQAEAQLASLRDLLDAATQEATAAAAALDEAEQTLQDNQASREWCNEQLAHANPMRQLQEIAEEIVGAAAPDLPVLGEGEQLAPIPSDERLLPWLSGPDVLRIVFDEMRFYQQARFDFLERECGLGEHAAPTEAEAAESQA